MHCAFSLSSGIFPLGFPAQRFSMAITQAIPPHNEEYHRSIDLYVFRVRESYEIAGMYAWFDV